MQGDVAFRLMLMAMMAATMMPHDAWAKVPGARSSDSAPHPAVAEAEKTTTATGTGTGTGTGRSEPQLTKEEWNRAVAELRHMHLLVPLEGFDPEKMKGSFYEKRGAQMHEAVDMPAPRNTPIHAVSDGTIAKLFLSRFGGTTIYQFDPQQRFVFYYAHLERYADGLKEKQSVRKGEIIGYVGTSGNAPPNTPHLHLSLSLLVDEKRWWEAAPVDPYEVFRMR